MMKNKKRLEILLSLVCTCSMLAGCGNTQTSSNEATTGTNDMRESTSSVQETADASTSNEVISVSTDYHLDKDLLAPCEPVQIQAQVTPYTIASDLSNVELMDRTNYWDQSWKDTLAKDGFLISDSGYYEAFEHYETNRYNIYANFVTTDSLLHTYHLYFSYLLKNTEKNYLVSTLHTLTDEMYATTMQQCESLKGTEWEAAANMNLAFFSVAKTLLDPSFACEASIADAVNAEISMIQKAEGIADSAILAGTSEDYSQYKVRGYYEYEEDLHPYFKTMMWYGRRLYGSEEDLCNRAALLSTLALKEDALNNWKKLYTITAFFAGTSDDNGYYEYLPVIQQAYGDTVTVESIVGNAEAYDQYVALVKELPAPMIQSAIVYAGESDEEKAKHNEGYRFMGQRFTIDASIFSDLIYSRIKENENGEFRMLPDALDVPAALGSDVALNILEAQGDTKYKGYTEKMDAFRATSKTAPASFWNKSLYSEWLHTLTPLLQQKSEGYPFFMQNEKWTKKNLVTFLGSYAELKHDTVLYAKQVVAEMGGGDEPTWDDRGYVEPEVQVYAYLANLVRCTSKGLETFGCISEKDKSNLELLTQLSEKLQLISEKELRNELPTEEEFELIRTYGGQLEHFWGDVNAKEDGTCITTQEFPGAVITDIATDPNGSCLEVGIGGFNTVYVVAPVDGKLKLCSGSVFSFYQFEQPINDRLTDTEWRRMIGLSMEMDEDYRIIPYEGETPTYPAWEADIIEEYE